MRLALDVLRRDGGTQPRAAIKLDVAYEYGDEMKAGAKFPPVVVFYDGSEYWLADGFHRLEGASAVGLDEIECEVLQGTVEDAQWYSFGVNKSHGLRRTNEDKQRAIKAALKHPNGVTATDEKIALHVGVDAKTVATWRADLVARLEIPDVTVRHGRDGKKYDTSKQGKRKQVESLPAVEVSPEIAPSAPAPVTRNTGGNHTETEPERPASVARDTESVASAVWKILDSESTPGEIAAYIVDSKIDISSWEDARDFLTEAIENAKRG